MNLFYLHIRKLHLLLNLVHLKLHFVQASMQRPIEQKTALPTLYLKSFIYIFIWI